MTPQNESKKNLDSIVRITINKQVDAFPRGVTLKEAIARLLPEQADQVLCALHGGICVELNQPIEADCELSPLTYQDEEGRRVYERSLRFLFLLAMSRLYPGQNVRVLNSIGYGVYLQLEGGEFTHDMVRALEVEMRKLVKEDLPFQRESWSRAEAIAYFTAKGWKDKARILRYRPHDHIPMYRIEDLCEYFYGAMLPSTGYIRAFSLKPHFPGLVLQFPSPAAPSVPAPYLPRPKHLRVFSQSQKWCGILGAQTVADVNRMIESGRIREFIRINDR